MSKILIEGNKVIIDGHANDLETCNTLTNLCDELSTSEKFRTVKYESGYGEFESVSESEGKKFKPDAGTVRLYIKSNDGSSLLYDGYYNDNGLTITPTGVSWQSNGQNHEYIYTGSKVFLGLSNTPNATVAKYTYGTVSVDEYISGSDLLLYIVEQNTGYKVNVNSNDGTTTLAQNATVDSVVVTSTGAQLKCGDAIKTTYTYSGSKLFAGLATSANALVAEYKPGDTVPITAETTFYIVENIIIPEHHSSLNELFTNIASVIREKTGETGIIAAAQFPSVIRNRLKAAPIGFYLSTDEGYSEFFPMTPGQTLNEFVTSDNTGKFRMNGIDLPTFFEIYFIDTNMDSVIVKNNNYRLKPIWHNYDLNTPVMLDPEGNNTANGGVAIVFKSDDYCNTFGIAQSEYINVGIAANTAVNRVLLHKDLSHIDGETSDWTIDDYETHFQKPFSDLKVITTAPITVWDREGYLSSVGDVGQLIIPLPLYITDITGVMALFTYIEDLSSPDKVRSESFVTDVYLDPSNGNVNSPAACLYVDFSQSKNIATTPCVISIIG